MRTGIGRDFAAAAHIQFLQCVPNMVLDRIFTDNEFGGDLAIGAASRQLTHDLGFARGQVDPIAGTGRGIGLNDHELFQNSQSHTRRNGRFTTGSRAQPC